MHFPTMILSLLSDDLVFFQDNEIVWDGTRHSITGLQVNLPNAQQLSEIVAEGGFDDTNDLLNHFVGFMMQLAEPDDGLIVPRENISSALYPAIREGDLTGLTLANLAACGKAFFVQNPGDNKYLVGYDGRLAQGIPEFFNLVARLIWNLRQGLDSLQGKPFEVTFMQVRNFDFDAYVDGEVSAVAGAQDFPGTLYVTEPPQIEIPKAETPDEPLFTIAIDEATEDEKTRLRMESILSDIPLVLKIQGTAYLNRTPRFERLREGETLVVATDWNSEHYDPVALEVFNSKGETLGYTCRDEYYYAAGQLDEGWGCLAAIMPHLKATVDSVTPLSARRKGSKYPLMDIRFELIDDLSVEEALAELEKNMLVPSEERILLSADAGITADQLKGAIDVSHAGCGDGAAFDDVLENGDGSDVTVCAQIDVDAIRKAIEAVAAVAQAKAAPAPVSSLAKAEGPAFACVVPEGWVNTGDDGSHPFVLAPTGADSDNDPVHIFYAKAPTTDDTSHMTPEFARVLRRQMSYGQLDITFMPKPLSYHEVEAETGMVGVLQIQTGFMGIDTGVGFEFYVCPYFTGKADYLRVALYDWDRSRLDEAVNFVDGIARSICVDKPFVPECVSNFNECLEKKVDPERFEKLGLELLSPLIATRQMATDLATQEYNLYHGQDERGAYTAAFQEFAYINRSAQKYIDMLDAALEKQQELWGADSKEAKTISQSVENIKNATVITADALSDATPQQRSELERILGQDAKNEKSALVEPVEKAPSDAGESNAETAELSAQAQADLQHLKDLLDDAAKNAQAYKEARSRLKKAKDNLGQKNLALKELESSVARAKQRVTNINKKIEGAEDKLRTAQKALATIERISTIEIKLDDAKNSLSAAGFFEFSRKSALKDEIEARQKERARLWGIAKDSCHDLAESDAIDDSLKKCRKSCTGAKRNLTRLKSDLADEQGKIEADTKKASRAFSNSKSRLKKIGEECSESYSATVESLKVYIDFIAELDARWTAYTAAEKMALRHEPVGREHDLAMLAIACRRTDKKGFPLYDFEVDPKEHSADLEGYDVARANLYADISDTSSCKSKVRRENEKIALEFADAHRKVGGELFNHYDLMAACPTVTRFAAAHCIMSILVEYGLAKGDGSRNGKTVYKFV